MPINNMHKIQLNPLHQPVIQIEKHSPKRDVIINDEVNNFMDVGFIREVQYPEWLANIVVAAIRITNGESA